MATSPTWRRALGADGGVPHVVLVGLPGAGKSAVGALLASALGRPFLDFDVEIARREEMSVPDIFARSGEGHFRELEHQLTAELAARGGMVLAPGGGWILRPDTVALLRPPARLVYLRVTPATAVRRMGAGVAGRPLLRHPDPAGELARLLQARRAAYESADVVVDAESLTVQQVMRSVAAALGLGEAGSAGGSGTPG